jgi:predicted dinucleotide-binding enzyme
MKIGIIGSGNMGGSLAKIWANKGHEIFITSTSPEQTIQVVESIGGNTRMGTTREAVQFGDVIVFAFPYSSLQDVINKGGSFEGKIIIDLINPLTDDALGMLIGHTTSAAEEIAKLIPEAEVIKAFNTIASPVLQSEKGVVFNGIPPDVYFCGDDAEAKAVVKKLIEDSGFEAIESGPLTNARFLEPMAEFIIQLAFAGMGADIALKVLRR